NALGIGDVDELQLARAFFRRAMALQLDIEPVAEAGRERVAAWAGKLLLTTGNSPIERTRWTARQRNQPRVRVVQPSQLDMWRLVRWRFKECARGKPHEIAVALFIACKQHDARQFAQMRRLLSVTRPVFLIGEIDRECAADDWLNP